MRTRWLVALAGLGSLVGAARSAALPSSYGFSALGTSGAFSYDGDAGLGSVQFELAGFSLVPLDVGTSGPAGIALDPGGIQVLTLGGGALREGWPAVHDAFWVTSYEPAVLELAGDDVFDGANLRSGLSLADFTRARLSVQMFAIDLSPSPYLYGCAEGTPLPDCPESSYPFRDGFLFQIDLDEIHAIAEPSAICLVVLAAFASVASAKARRERS